MNQGRTGHARGLDTLTEESRKALLGSLGDAEDVTVIRTVGNLGDALIQEGTRRLLEGRRFREIALEEIPSSSGDVAVFPGSGGWCRPYHELFPQMLGLAERRFRRVVVFPSSFDTDVEEVHDRLAATRAVVFAREPDSFDRIRSLCDARLALDAAFFFDFSPWRRAGSETLDAFRTDRERVAGRPLPAGNRDLSVSAASLPAWLDEIARHDVVRTDRAHVMIAAALLGKTVEAHASATAKVPAIARWALRDLDVTVVPDPPPAVAPVPRTAEVEEVVRRLKARAGARPPEVGVAAAGEPRVTVVVLSWERLGETLRALDSIRESVRMPHRVMVVDNNSSPEVRVRLGEEARARGLELVALPRNLLASGGRQLAARRAGTEFVFFLDSDAEIFPGTLENLVDALDADPEAAAASARVVLPDGSVQHCGGSWEEEEGWLRFRLLERGTRFDDLPGGAPQRCDWVPGTAVLVRRALLLAHPLDAALSYFEDNEWCFRLRDEPGARFLRCPSALALHHLVPKYPQGLGPAEAIRSLNFIDALARIHARHGVTADTLLTVLPMVRSLHEGRRLRAARLLLELFSARGRDWFLLEWMGGGLDPLLVEPLAPALESATRERDEVRREAELLRSELGEIHQSRWWRAASRYWEFRRRLRPEPLEAPAAEPPRREEGAAVSPDTGPERTITLERPVVEGSTIRFRFAVRPPTPLYRAEEFFIRVPDSVDLGAVPTPLLDTLAILLLHAHWPLLRPCRVEPAFPLGPGQREGWEKVLAAEASTLDAYRGAPLPGGVVLHETGPASGRPVPLPPSDRAAAAFSGGKDSLLTAALLAELTDRPLLVTTTSPLPPLRDHDTARRRHVLDEIPRRRPVELLEATSDFRAIFRNDFARMVGIPVAVNELVDTHLYLASLLLCAAARGTTHLFLASETELQESVVRDGRTVQHPHLMYSAATQRALSALLAPVGIRLGSLTWPLHSAQVLRLLWTRYRDVADLQYSCWRVGDGEAACSRCSQCLRVALEVLALGEDPGVLGIDLPRLFTAQEGFRPRLDPGGDALPADRVAAALHAQVCRALADVPVRRVARRMAPAFLTRPREAASALGAYARLRGREQRPGTAPGLRARFLEWVDPLVRDRLAGIYRSSFREEPPEEYAGLFSRSEALAGEIVAPLAERS